MTISLHMVDIMDTIYQRQNEPGMVGTQKAARCLYRKAKIITGLNYIITIFLAVLFAVLATFIDDDRVGYWSFALSVITFLANFAFDHSIQKIKALAAGLQQDFDLYVLNLDRTKKYISKGVPEREKRIEAIAKYKDKNVGDVSNWYHDYSGLSQNNQILKCQQENIRWDGELRKRYIWVLIALCVIEVLVIVTFAIHGTGIINGIAVAVWVVPILKVAITTIVNLAKDIKRLNEIEQETEQAEALREDEVKLFECVCDLQHLIYEHRSQCCLIPDFFYRIFRKADEIREDKIKEETLREEKQNESDDKGED